MSEDRNSFRNITKAIGLFGGVKIFQILISIIKNKFIAVLLGPVGIGISGMILSTTSLVSSLTGFGLHTSAVRDVSKAYSSSDSGSISRTITILRKLVILTGLLGTVIVLVFAKQLSIWSFGNEEYTTAFRFVSIILFLDQVCIGQTVLMQGTFHYRYMARAALIGSVVGLFISVPLYYLWNVKAIVPVIVITSAMHLLLTWIYSRKIQIKETKLTVKELFIGGKIMLTLGIVIAITGVINTGQVYFLRTYISSHGSLEAVGLYTAGISIATQYINIILQAMGSDYSPRLAAVSDDKTLFVEIINRQITLLFTIIAPLIIFFIVFIKQLTILLYSTKFLSISGMIEWMMFGMLFRTISWCISFGFVAKGDSKFFFWNELSSSIYSLAFSIIGFELYSYTGMGIGFCLTYILYTIQMYIFGHKRFCFVFSKESFKKCLIMLSISTIMFATMRILNDSVYKYIIGTAFIIIISIISFIWLDKMIGIRTAIQGLKRKLIK